MRDKCEPCEKHKRFDGPWLYSGMTKLGLLHKVKDGMTACGAVWGF